MRRFVLVVLLIVLSLQFGMTAVADALEHVSFGHDHHAAVGQIIALDDANDSVPSHVNCEACHFFHSLAYANELSHANPFDCANDLPAITRDYHVSLILLDRPQRPKWPRPV